MTDQLIYRKQMLKALQVAKILNISRAFAYKLINKGDMTCHFLALFLHKNCIIQVLMPRNLILFPE